MILTFFQSLPSPLDHPKMVQKRSVNVMTIMDNPHFNSKLKVIASYVRM